MVEHRSHTLATTPGKGLLAAAAHSHEHGIAAGNADVPGNAAHMLHGLLQQSPMCHQPCDWIVVLMKAFCARI